jgi:hypothetical protein
VFDTFAIALIVANNAKAKKMGIMAENGLTTK